jgi:hypothetical protein
MAGLFKFGHYQLFSVRSGTLVLGYRVVKCAGKRHGAKASPETVLTICAARSVGKLSD